MPVSLRKAHMPNKRPLTLLLVFFLFPTRALLGNEITVVLTSKAFQYVPLVIAQDRGFLKEEGYRS
jgi:ABC-type nitrate/sulfonate/bicarbonate transport system substrate-binding protein